ncbi:transcriptional repressor [Candidatus Saccharibacteria bacterium]|nr:transcriptional repressor [Candidatus Saccharibacteria bacterium]
MQELSQIFDQEMRRARLRITRNRREIFYILKNSNRPLSIKEIIKTSKGDSSFTSVYRSVDSLTHAGILRLVPRGFKNLYELGEAFRPHHHHATCEKCGESVAVHDADLEKMMHHLTISTGLKPTGHQFELFGVCRRCRDSKDL